METKGNVQTDSQIVHELVHVSQEATGTHPQTLEDSTRSVWGSGNLAVPSRSDDETNDPYWRGRGLE
jgi:hypothetical protein